MSYGSKIQKMQTKSAGFFFVMWSKVLLVGYDITFSILACPLDTISLISLDIIFSVGYYFLTNHICNIMTTITNKLYDLIKIQTNNVLEFAQMG